MKNHPRSSAFISVMRHPVATSFFCKKLAVFPSFSHIRVGFLLLIVFSLLSCSKRPSPEEIEARRLLELARLEGAIQNAKNAAISEYVASLSDEVKISQLFLVNIEGNQKYSAVEKTGSLYGKAGEGNPLVPGGVLLFSYNISKDPLETYEYIKSIRDFYLENENLPPYVAVDQEGGDVNRLRGLTSVLWAQKKVADSFSLEGASALYSAQARQMKNLGFHMNLAPVVEVLTEKNQDFLDTRSFGNLEAVLSYGEIAINSYEEMGIAVVLKHFPGNSNADPHIGLPKITYSASDYDSYFKPFEVLLPKASALLMSHAIMKEDKDLSAGEIFSLEDSDVPACFSRHWIRDVAKNQYKFDGLIFSDDIFMGALSKNGYPPEKAALEAIKAGVDVIMLSEKRFGGVAGILLSKAKEDQDFAKEINRAAENVIRYKIKAGILELIEMDDGAGEYSELKDSPFQKNDEKIPSFSVKVKHDYADFDLYRFNEDYKAGMKAFEMSK